MTEYVTITTVIPLDRVEEVKTYLAEFELTGTNVTKEGGSTPPGPPDLGTCDECGEPIAANGGENYTVDGITGNIDWKQCVNGHRVETFTASE